VPASAARIPWQAATINRYMIEMVRGGCVWDAGKAWYSFVPDPFVLDEEPVKEICQALEQKFPLLGFSCWSTQQVNPFMHHLLGSFVTFVYTERDTMQDVFEFLRTAGWAVYLNPTKREAAKSFAVADKTVVIRPAITAAPTHGSVARIEKILVDICVELDSLSLMAEAEFQAMANRLAASQRIAMASLVAYCRRRKIMMSDVFGNRESIIYTVARKRR
jgi:hypothetical protein